MKMVVLVVLFGIQGLLFLSVVLAYEWIHDFCVSDAESPVLLNGMACKDPRKVEAEDFFFSGLHIQREIINQLGTRVTSVTSTQVPGLNSLGISIARIDFAPWGINPPHTHPRASEILTVLEGTLEMGFVTSSPENRQITKILEKGDAFVFPVGLIHYQRNIGPTKAVAIACFNSQNPGVITIAKALFGSVPDIPNDLLVKAFHIDDNVVNFLKSKF